MWIDFLHVARYGLLKVIAIRQKLTQHVECQQSTPKPFACYSSAANDVWSLGVILVNLTCGRNPWKRASMEDSTFKSFMRDSSFLQSILPLSDELSSILRRIFEVDPRRRITIPELRNRIIGCPKFTRNTSTPNTPPTPPYTVADSTIKGACFGSYPAPEFIPLMDQLPGPQYPMGSQGLITPPCSLSPTGSVSSSSSGNSYTYSAKPAAQNINSLFAYQSAAAQAAPAWPRCNQFIPAMNDVPRSGCFWNMPGY